MKGMEFPLGFDSENNFRKEDLSELNHLLISGGSGFGKSNFIDSIILSLIAHNSPEKVKFIMCDTKSSEFSRYSDMDHLMMPIATCQREISISLGVALSMGEDRLKEFSGNGVKTISSFNDIAWENYEREVPRIVVVVDDLSAVVNLPGATRSANIFAMERVESILSIGRASGIHLIAATQTPAKKQMKGVSSRFFSKIIFCSPVQSDIRFLTGKKMQGPKPEPGEAMFCNVENCETIHTLLVGKSDFSLIDTDPDPDIVDKAAEIAISEGSIGEAKLQGKLGIGRNQATNVLAQLEEIGLIGPPDNFGNRAALISKEQWDQAMEQLEDE